ncbi:MAG: invasion associated locus B family protein [Reyranellaceae bacterium]
MVRRNSIHGRVALFALLTGVALAWLPPVAWAQDNVAAWRVDCGGDGKTLDCRAIQQMINRDDKQVVVVVSARIPSDTKSPVLTIQLPLGISLVEPVQIKIDNGAVERYPVQTCTNVGCIVNVPLKDPLLAALRGGTLLKITIQDTNKRTINIDVPLLGFGLAYDKMSK